MRFCLIFPWTFLHYLKPSQIYEGITFLISILPAKPCACYDPIIRQYVGEDCSINSKILRNEKSMELGRSIKNIGIKRFELEEKWSSYLCERLISLVDRGRATGWPGGGWWTNRQHLHRGQRRLGANGPASYQITGLNGTSKHLPHCWAARYLIIANYS